MLIQQNIEEKLANGLKLSHCEVVNESHMHNVPKDSESHFKLVLVADEFQGLPLVKRHKMVYQLLSDELQGAVHALALHTYSEKEWTDKHGEAPMSPPCLGGSKK